VAAPASLPECQAFLNSPLTRERALKSLAFWRAESYIIPNITMCRLFKI
jgi:hypothetical protein